MTGVISGRFRRDAALALLCAWQLLASACASTGDPPPASGPIRFTVPTARGPLTVHAFLPEPGAGNAPALVVMHGLQRDAPEGLRSWIAHARERKVVLVVPEFDKAGWPASQQYPLGDVMTAQGTATPPQDWAFAAVDRAVDEAMRRAGRAAGSTRMDLYGHGAGAQFVQRYVLHTGAHRVRMAIAANAGWYLLPEASFDFPYGLRNLPIPDERLRDALAARLVVLLGNEDLRTDGVIRRNAQAMAQGPDRLSRGRFYFGRATQAAARLGVKLRWQLQEVPGVGHSDGDMIPVARALLDAEPTEPGRPQSMLP